MTKQTKKDASKIKVLNPYTGKLVGNARKSSKSDILKAVKKAKEAFRLNKLSPYKRQQIFKDTCSLMVKNKEEIAELITKETGKPINESRGEVDRAVFVISQCAEETMRIIGEVLPCGVTSSEIDKQAIATRRPLGVIAAITPFNYPLNVAAHKIGPALAAGNSVVLKPSPLACLTPVKLKEIMVAAGLPEDMFIIVNGYKEEAEALAASEVRMVTFTGSVSGGKNVARAAGIKKLSLELGGNSALIVFDDGDIPSAVKTCIDQRFRTAGQRCTAIKRLFVHKKIYDKFISLLIKETKKLDSRDPMEPGCDIGPLVTEAAAVLVEQRIKDAVKKGAKILNGGARKGSFISPTILGNVPENCDLVCEETFGPVLPVFGFEGLEEVITKVNSTKYGLQAGVYTNKMDVIKRLSKELEVGALIVNDGPGFRVESIPFGGVKESGIGREGVRYAIHEMTELVTLVM